MERPARAPWLENSQLLRASHSIFPSACVLSYPRLDETGLVGLHFGPVLIGPNLSILLLFSLASCSTRLLYFLLNNSLFNIRKNYGLLSRSQKILIPHLTANSNLRTLYWMEFLAPHSIGFFIRTINTLRKHNFTRMDPTTLLPPPPPLLPACLRRPSPWPPPSLVLNGRLYHIAR